MRYGHCDGSQGDDDAQRSNRPGETFPTSPALGFGRGDRGRIRGRLGFLRHPLQLIDEVTRRLPPIVRIFLETLAEHSVEGG